MVKNTRQKPAAQRSAPKVKRRPVEGVIVEPEPARKVDPEPTPPLKSTPRRAAAGSTKAPGTALVRIEREAAPLATPLNAGRRALVDMWLEGRSPQTLRAYKKDLEDFAGFLKLTTGEEAANYLTSRTHAEANELVLSYRNSMVGEKLAPATINRRLAALRSLIKLANLLGHVVWLLGVENVKGEKYRDTAGPGEEKIATIVAMLEEEATPKARRDLAIIHLLFDMGLRRGEVAELRLEHVRFEGSRGTVSVMGKGRRERVDYTMPSIAVAAIKTWLKEQKDIQHGDSLFGVTGQAIWNILDNVSKRAGVGHVRPHGLRHSGITRALDATDGNIRKVQKFSRHKNVNTLMIYDDNRRDFFGEIAELASSKKGEKK